MVARPPTVVKGPFAHANQIDADRVAVQFGDFAPGGRAAALVRLLARRTRADDQQVDVRIRAKVAPGAGAEQDDSVRAHYLANGASNRAGFWVGRPMR